MTNSISKPVFSGNRTTDQAVSILHQNDLLIQKRLNTNETDIDTLEEQQDDYIKKDGTESLTADWDAGSHEIKAETFESDVSTGTAPITVASTTMVTNLNADKLDGYDASDIDYSFVSGNDASTDVTSSELEELSDGSDTTLHTHDHGNLSGKSDNDHPQYLLKTDIDDAPADDADTALSSKWIYDNLNGGPYLPTSSVENSLTSGSGTDALSAQQGQILRESQSMAFSVPGTLYTDTDGIDGVGLVVGVPFTISTVRLAVSTAPTGASLIVDILKNGTSIYNSTPANRPTITAGNTSATGGTPDTTTFSAGDIILIAIDQVGSTVAGENLYVNIKTLTDQTVA